MLDPLVSNNTTPRCDWKVYREVTIGSDSHQSLMYSKLSYINATGDWAEECVFENTHLEKFEKESDTCIQFITVTSNNQIRQGS